MRLSRTPNDTDSRRSRLPISRPGCDFATVGAAAIRRTSRPFSRTNRSRATVAEFAPPALISERALPIVA